MGIDKKEGVMKKIILGISILLLSYFPCFAEIYTYFDKNGVLHFTNTPTSNKFIPYQSKKEQQKESILYAQKMLNEMGYNVGSPDGILGKNTKKAIVSFQKNNDLKLTGIFDEKTITKLKNLEKEMELKIAQKRLKIIKAQKILSEAEYNISNIDGELDEQTKTALSEFQKDNNLNVTGKLDTVTWHLLLQDKRGFNIETKIHCVTNMFYDSDGFDINAFDEDGYNAKGYNKSGFDKDGYNAKGYDKFGFGKDGYNENNFDKNGIHKFTRVKYDENDYDIEGSLNVDKYKTLATSDILFIFEEIKSINTLITKDQFETTKSFKKRLSNLEKIKLKSKNDLLNTVFVINFTFKPLPDELLPLSEFLPDGIHIKYSADQEIFSVKMENKLTVTKKVTPQGNYMVVNIYGTEFMVEKILYMTEKVLFSNRKNINFVFNVDLAIAKKRQLTSQFFYKLNNSLDADIDTFETKPKFDKPKHYLFLHYELAVDPIGFAVYDVDKNLLHYENLFGD